MKTKNAKELEKDRIRESRRVFIRKMNDLFRSEYRYSHRFNKDHIQEDGKVNIHVDLTKVEEGPFSIYSYGRRIDPEIYNYIDQEAFFLRADVPLIVTFDDGGRYSPELKQKIRDAVIRHYDRNNKIGLFALILGVTVLIIYIVLAIIFNNRNLNTVFIELLLIMSWMLIWSSLDHFIFIGGDLRKDSFNAGQLALMEVRFTSDSKENNN